MIVLAGDVGGTNARLATVDVEGRTATIRHEARFPSHDFPGLAALVQRYLSDGGDRPERACFGIAGPVFGEEVTATNLPWTINARAVATAIGIPRTGLINDFVAVGHGIAMLGPGQLATIHPGQPVAQGPIATIGAGTGLGEGLLFWEGDHYRVYPSEGGHGDFAPRGPAQAGLADELRRQFGHVSRERVISGPGLVSAYRYLASQRDPTEQPAVRAEMDAGDPGAVITKHGLAGTDPLCAKALDLFIDAFGAEAGNLALTAVAIGGVYLAGGIAPRIVERLRSGLFLAAFRDKGRMSGLVSQIPIHVIMEPDVGILGAAAEATRL